MGEGEYGARKWRVIQYKDFKLLMYIEACSLAAQASMLSSDIEF